MKRNTADANITLEESLSFIEAWVFCYFLLILYLFEHLVGLSLPATINISVLGCCYFLVWPMYIFSRLSVVFILSLVQVVLNVTTSRLVFNTSILWNIAVVGIVSVLWNVSFARSVYLALCPRTLPWTTTAPLERNWKKATKTILCSWRSSLIQAKFSISFCNLWHVTLYPLQWVRIKV